MKDPDGSILGINVVAKETTEHKRSEAALAASEQRYRALVRATSSLVWATSADGQIVDMPEWRAYTGNSVEQLKGRGWLDTLHPDDRDHTAVVWQKAVDSRSLYETEYRIRRRDGSTSGIRRAECQWQERRLLPRLWKCRRVIGASRSGNWQLKLKTCAHTNH